MKQVLKTILFPHIAIAVGLLPVSLVIMLLCMAKYGQASIITALSYALAFYSLTVFCLRIPDVIKHFKQLRKTNRFAVRWSSDVRLRVGITLTAGGGWNGAYGIMQLCLCVYHRSAWFGALAGYYLLLALIRLALSFYIHKYPPCSDMRRELKYYSIVGWIFLAINAMLSAMIFYMIYENRITRHHEITTIALATYTFVSLAMAIVNVVKYRRLGSPVFSASKAISLASACVSMLTLEGTMLVTFDNGEMSDKTRHIFLAASGAVVAMLTVVMAIYILINGNKKIKLLENENEQ